jgi:hypothetical protein
VAEPTIWVYPPSSTPFREGKETPYSMLIQEPTLPRSDLSSQTPSRSD